jgi:hypothetical protein
LDRVHILAELVVQGVKQKSGLEGSERKDVLQGREARLDAIDVFLGEIRQRKV